MPVLLSVAAIRRRASGVLLVGSEGHETASKKRKGREMDTGGGGWRGSFRRWIGERC